MGRILNLLTSLARTKPVHISIMILLVLAKSGHAAAQPQWPQEITGQQGTVVVYQTSA